MNNDEQNSSWSAEMIPKDTVVGEEKKKSSAWVYIWRIFIGLFLLANILAFLALLMDTSGHSFAPVLFAIVWFFGAWIFGGLVVFQAIFTAVRFLYKKNSTLGLVAILIVVILLATLVMRIL